MRRTLTVLFVLSAAVQSQGCDCGSGSQISDATALMDSAQADADTGTGGPEAGADSGPTPDRCGSTPCCAEESLPELNEYNRLVDGYDFAEFATFDPEQPAGVTNHIGRWQSHIITAGIHDISFLLEDDSPLHLFVHSDVVPDFALDQSVALQTDIVPFSIGSSLRVRVVVSLRDPASEELYAVYYVGAPGPGGENPAYYEPSVIIVPVTVSRSVSCQGPEIFTCANQVQLFDLTFSMGDVEIILGQGESGTLEAAGLRYSVSNRRSLDTGGEASEKGTCGIAGIRSFDIVRLP